MGSAPTFPLSVAPPVAPPSADLIHLSVEVDRTRCATTVPLLTDRLTALETEGITISIAQLVANANLFYMGSVADEGSGVVEARMRAAWEALPHWGMEAVPHHTDAERTVLRVAQQPNSRDTAFRSEVLSIGVAVEVGIRLYAVAYPYWSATEGLEAFDLQATDEDGLEYRIEARGRIDRTNVAAAKTQVHAKFPIANFSHAAGVIFFPRTTNRGRGDIIVLDPDGKPGNSLRNRRYRNLMLHYVPIFIAQGGYLRDFGESIRALARATDGRFDDYLSGKETALQASSALRRHASFGWRGTLYIGRFFEDFVWPTWMTGESLPGGGGVFFWGIAKDIVVAIANGTLKDVRFSAEERAAVQRQKNLIAIIMPDRSLLIWGKTLQELEDTEDQEVRKEAK